MRVETVNGKPLRDIIDWRWEASDATCQLSVLTPDDGLTYPCTLEREAGLGHRVRGRTVRRNPNLRQRLPVLLHAHAARRRPRLPQPARRRLPALVPPGQLREPHQRDGRRPGPHHRVPAGSHERLAPRRVTRRQAVAHRPARPAWPRRAAGALRRRARGPWAIVLCAAGSTTAAGLHRTLDWVERDNITSWRSSLWLHQVLAELLPLVLGGRGGVQRSSGSSSPTSTVPGSGWGARGSALGRFYLDAQLPVPESETHGRPPAVLRQHQDAQSFLDEARDICQDHAGELDGIVGGLRSRGLRALAVCGEAAEGVIRGFCSAWAQGWSPPSPSITTTAATST